MIGPPYLFSNLRSRKRQKMKGFLKFVGLCALISTTPVTSLEFVPSPSRFVIGDTGTLTMRCSVNEDNVKEVYNIYMKRESFPGSNSEQTLASITNLKDAELDDDIKTNNDKDFEVTGSVSNTPPYLELAMSRQKLECRDARVYMCLSTYFSTNDLPEGPKVNATIEAYVLPAMMGPLESKKNRVYVEGGDALNKAQFDVGDQLELTCRANIGSIQSTRIQWRKTSEIDDNFFNQYNPAANMLTETDALSDNNCGYTRTSILRYNITASDAAYNLAFECYVAVTGYPISTVTPGGSYETKNNLRYYLNVDSDEPPSNEVASAGAGGNVGAIIGGVIGGLVAIIIIVVVVWFLLFRRRDGETYTTKEEYGSENPNMAPPLDTYAAVDKSKKRGHENRGLDEPHESDRSRRHHYDNNRGAKANYGMDRDDDYDGYDRDGSPTMGHQGINHMGLDPVDGRIGTGV